MCAPFKWNVVFNQTEAKKNTLMWCRGRYRGRAQCLSNLGQILSGPTALDGSREFNAQESITFIYGNFTYARLGSRNYVD